jgi:hypothetical protein
MATMTTNTPHSEAVSGSRAPASGAGGPRPQEGLGAVLQPASGSRDGGPPRVGLPDDRRQGRPRRRRRVPDHRLPEGVRGALPGRLHHQVRGSSATGLSCRSCRSRRSGSPAADGSFDMNVPPEQWGWRVLMAVSDDVTPAVFDDAVAEVRRKKGDSTRWIGCASSAGAKAAAPRSCTSGRTARSDPRSNGSTPSSPPRAAGRAAPTTRSTWATRAGPIRPSSRRCCASRWSSGGAGGPRAGVAAYRPRISGRAPPASSLTDGPQHEAHVGRPLGQAAHEVRIPLPPYGT